MKAIGWAGNVKNFLTRGLFPHQMSFFLDLLARNLLLSPQKLASRLPLTSTSYVLEVGASFYSVEIARKVLEGHLELLDIQPEMLKKLEGNSKRENCPMSDTRSRTQDFYRLRKARLM